jgi:hypothetical protein
MRRIIRIADLSHIPTPSHDTYSPAEMEAARVVMVARNLRFDNATGVLSDDRLGWLSRPSNPADHTPHECEADVMRWEFRACIANSASRVSRGYSA